MFGFSMIKSLRLFPLVFILIWMNPVRSAEEVNNRINIGILGLTPYGFKTKDGRDAGYIFDITGEIRKTVKFPGFDEILPVKRLLRELNTGRLDCSIMARGPITEKSFEMLAPIGKEVEGVVVPRAGVKLATYDDLKKLSIAVPDGINIDAQFDKDTSMHKFTSNGYRQSTLLLKNGRVDAMYGAWDSYLFNMRQVGLKRRDIGERYVFTKSSMWLMCRRDYDNNVVKRRLIEVTNELRDRKVFKKIISRYLGEYE